MLSGAPADGPSISAVRKLLDEPLRVALADGRVLVGRFSCFDKQRNVLLHETCEQRFADSAEPAQPRTPAFERHLGLVLVPRKHIVAVHALSPDVYS